MSEESGNEVGRGNSSDGEEQRVNCRCGDIHEVYDGYRYCPYFYEKVNLLASKEDVEPLHILSTGKWVRPVSDSELGIDQ